MEDFELEKPDLEPPFEMSGLGRISVFAPLRLLDAAFRYRRRAAGRRERHALLRDGSLLLRVEQSQAAN